MADPAPLPRPRSGASSAEARTPEVLPPRADERAAAARAVDHIVRGVTGRAGDRSDAFRLAPRHRDRLTDIVTDRNLAPRVRAARVAAAVSVLHNRQIAARVKARAAADGPQIRQFAAQVDAWKSTQVPGDELFTRLGRDVSKAAGRAWAAVRDAVPGLRGPHSGPSTPSPTGTPSRGVAPASRSGIRTAPPSPGDGSVPRLAVTPARTAGSVASFRSPGTPVRGAGVDSSVVRPDPPAALQVVRHPVPAPGAPSR